MTLAAVAVPQNSDALSLSELADWLSGLNNLAKGARRSYGLRQSISDVIAISKRIYCSGRLGFKVNAKQITFPRARLRDLETAIKNGTVNCGFIEAYPASIDIRDASVFDMTALEFQIEHARCRAVRFILPSELMVGQLRYPLDGDMSPVLSAAEAPTGSGLIEDSQIAAAYNLLVPQPRIRELAGTAAFVFTSFATNAACDDVDLMMADATDPSRSFANRVMRPGRSMTPAQFVAFSSYFAAARPGAWEQFPASGLPEWLTAITPDKVVYAYSSRLGIGIHALAPDDWVVPFLGRRAVL